jgi:hypothetical protein
MKASNPSSAPASPVAVTDQNIAADDVQLELPETGFCSVDLASPDLTGGGACCGGPASPDATACCALDEAKKREGEAGCGCSSPRATTAATPFN